ncbi:hypothetical protein VIBNIAM115_1490007 [Vibrio nigripulchritudo AM115]|nr:hypothetical protein VIBNIAM115_1490007 [Vibrio nigripulchritudo AM115]
MFLAVRVNAFCYTYNSYAENIPQRYLLICIGLSNNLSMIFNDRSSTLLSIIF